MSMFRKRLENAVQQGSTGQNNHAQLVQDYKNRRAMVLVQKVHAIANEIVEGTKLRVYKQQTTGPDKSGFYIKILTTDPNARDNIITHVAITKQIFLLPPSVCSELIPHISYSNSGEEKIVALCLHTDEVICDSIRSAMEEDVLRYAKNNPQYV